MTQLLKTPEVYAVEVPMEATNFMHEGLDDFTILGTVTSGTIDFDVSGLVEKHRDYERKNWQPQYNSDHSFLSLMRSKQLDLSKKFVIIKRK